MDDNAKRSGSPAAQQSDEEEMELRRGPWTVDEDLILINYIATHGEGRWNSLAHSAGLRRTGKSCRLRWLNYLRPDVRRGNFTLEEQLLILELHARWGNRWSKIAQYLPGRTDNEIRNYWKTRVEKHAKQLRCDVNSQQFKDAMRRLWMPRLVERIQATSEHNKKENRYRNLEKQLAGKEKASDNNLECPWPLFTETSNEEDRDGGSESKSQEYSGPSCVNFQGPQSSVSN